MINSLQFSRSLVVRLATAFRFLGGFFGVEGFAGGEDGFLAVDEVVQVVDDLQIVGIAVHFGQRVETFDDGAVGRVGILAGCFSRAGDDGSLLAVAVGEDDDEFFHSPLSTVPPICQGLPFGGGW